MPASDFTPTCRFVSAVFEHFAWSAVQEFYVSYIHFDGTMPLCAQIFWNCFTVEDVDTEIFFETSGSTHLSIQRHNLECSEIPLWALRFSPFSFCRIHCSVLHPFWMLPSEFLIRNSVRIYCVITPSDVYSKRVAHRKCCSDG